MYRIGIDLGGTNIAVGVVDSGYHLISETSVPPEPAVRRSRWWRTCAAPWSWHWTRRA